MLSAINGFPWRLALAVGAVPLGMIASLALTFRTVNQDVVYPRVRVAGAPVGGLPVVDARAAVRRATEARVQQEIVLRAGEKVWRRRLAALGVGTDDRTVGAALDDAWRIGHRDSWHEWWPDAVLMVRGGVDVAPRFTLDRDLARQSLVSLAPAVEREPVDAEVVLIQAGDGYEVHLTPSTTGIRLDVEATVDAIGTSLARGGEVVVDLVTVVTRANVSTEALRTATAAATALVDDPIELVDPEDPRRRTVLDAPTAHAMLELGRERGGALTSATLDPSALRAWISSVGATVDRPPTNPRVALEQGRLVVIPGVAGRRLDVEATARRVEAKLGTDGHAVEMVVNPDRPWIPLEVVEEARAQIEAATRDPIVLVVAADDLAPERRITVTNDVLRSWLALPDSQSIPRDTSRMPPATRPTLAWAVDGTALGEYLQTAVVPVISAGAQPPRLLVVARPDTAPESRANPAVPSGTVLEPGSMATPTPLPGGALSSRGTATPSSGARTAIALGTAIAGPTRTPGPDPSRTIVASSGPRPTATTIGSVVTVTPSGAFSLPEIAAEPQAFRFEAVVVPGRPARAVDMDGLRTAIDALLHADLPPLQGILVAPPTATVTGGARALSGTAAAVVSVTATVTRSPTATVTPSPTVAPTASATATAAGAPGASAALILLGTPAAAPTSDARLDDARGAGFPRPRTVLVRVVDPPPDGAAESLRRMARTANVLISAPVIVEWSSREWRVEPNDLVDLLRFGPVGDGADGYLGRDGLLAVAERIGREASRLDDAPRDARDTVLPVDVPMTAAAIWAAANRTGFERRAEIAWVEDEPTPVPGVTTPMSGPPTATRTPVRNPGPQLVATATTSPTLTP